jgi:hypothetical protein
VGVSSREINPEKKIGKNKPGFEKRHPKSGSGFENGIFKFKNPEAKPKTGVGFPSPKIAFFQRLKNKGRGICPRNKGRNKGGYKDPQMGAFFQGAFLGQPPQTQHPVQRGL